MHSARNVLAVISELIDDGKIAFSFLRNPTTETIKAGWSEPKPISDERAKQSLGIPIRISYLTHKHKRNSHQAQKITRARARKIQRSTERESALMAAVAAVR